MELSIREARAQFAKAIEAAQRGERVTITKNGKPVAELGPPTEKKGGLDWDRLERVRRELGLDKWEGPPLDEAWRERFDDPAWGRELFGLGDDWDPTRP
jgi:prevent-host-death family protein